VNDILSHGRFPQKTLIFGEFTILETCGHVRLNAPLAPVYPAFPRQFQPNADLAKSPRLTGNFPLLDFFLPRIPTKKQDLSAGFTAGDRS
jgi:hypothetical protein